MIHINYINSESNVHEGFNFYKRDDPIIDNFYLNNNNDKYYPCDKSCKSSSDNEHCKLCTENYYFKVTKTSIIPGLCFRDIKEG